MPRTWIGKAQQPFIRILIRAGLAFIRVLSSWIPVGLQVRLGAGLGLLSYYGLGKERRKTLAQLQQAFEGERHPEDQRRIARDCFQNLGRTFFEVLNMGRICRSGIERIVSVEGEAGLKTALTSGKGVIFVGAHIGNWELLALVIGRLCRLTVIAAPVYDPYLGQVMMDLRSANGVHTLVRDTPGSLRKILAQLRKGGVIGIMLDQDTKTDGVFVPFFHRMAYTTTGAASLALRTGAAVVVGFIKREGLMNHRVMIHGPISLASTGDLKRDVEVGTTQLTKMIEDQIRQTPEQWVWMHRRWKTPYREGATS